MIHSSTSRVNYNLSLAIKIQDPQRIQGRATPIKFHNVLTPICCASEEQTINHLYNFMLFSPLHHAISMQYQCREPARLGLPPPTGLDPGSTVKTRTGTLVISLYKHYIQIKWSKSNTTDLANVLNQTRKTTLIMDRDNNFPVLILCHFFKLVIFSSKISTHMALATK